MKTIEESVEVAVPVRAAYAQWRRFESFPRFMEGIVRVDRLDGGRLHWVADVAGEIREWDAEITVQEPDQRVTWRALDRGGPHGAVTFHALDESRTEIRVQMGYDPEGAKESVGHALGLDSRRVKGDLESFKRYVEAGTAAGA